MYWEMWYIKRVRDWQTHSVADIQSLVCYVVHCKHEKNFSRRSLGWHALYPTARACLWEIVEPSEWRRWEVDLFIINRITIHINLFCLIKFLRTFIFLTDYIKNFIILFGLKCINDNVFNNTLLARIHIIRFKLKWN